MKAAHNVAPVSHERAGNDRSRSKKQKSSEANTNKRRKAEHMTRSELLNKLEGRTDRSAHSWGGSSLIYDHDIAERVCTPSELKRTRNGERMTNYKEYLKNVKEEIERHCNSDHRNEDGEEVTLYDYLENVLDFEITISSGMEYASCKAWVTLGGPNIWIDTATQEIKLAWGASRESVCLDRNICDEIDAYFEEIYNCR